MRRITLFISVALALLVFAIPATASAKRSHHKSHHSRVRDRNHNGIPDRWEHKFHVHKATADPDRDGVTNIGEFHDGTNPRDADTDNDGVKDGQDDANHDGIEDQDEQSGVIDSFDATTGKLTVTLVNGDSLTGTVTSDTEIECENTTTTASTRHDGESGDDNSGSGSTQSGDDNSGPGSTNSGDDDQGDNNDPGDDNDDQGENENEGSCSTDALQPTTIVKEAELRLTSAGAVFEKIELGGKAQA
jgi:hypothetical protein